MLKALFVFLFAVMPAISYAAPVAKCDTPAAVMKKTPAKYPLVATVEGDELIRLKAHDPDYVLPEGTDKLLVFSVGSDLLYVMAIFKGGCYISAGGITPSMLAKSKAPKGESL